MFIASDKMADDLRSSFYKKRREFYILARGRTVNEWGLFYSGYTLAGYYGWNCPEITWKIFHSKILYEIRDFYLTCATDTLLIALIINNSSFQKYYGMNSWYLHTYRGNLVYPWIAGEAEKIMRKIFCISEETMSLINFDASFTWAI